MAKLVELWKETLDSLWFVPAVLTLAGAGLAILLVGMDDEVFTGLDATGLWWLFGGTADGAHGVLSAISGSIITVTGVVFSVTIVALQLASSQFTPRVLRQFTADRANQIVLGVFIGTFTYTLLVQRTVRAEYNGEDAFVPNVAVTVAVLLALVSIGFLIFFINHAARSIQASVIIDSVTTDTLRVLSNVFPERVEDGAEPLAATVADYSADRPDPPFQLTCAQAGYLQAVDDRRLTQLSESAQLLIRLEIEIGTHVLPGQLVMSVWPRADVRDEHVPQLRRALILGLERTPHQDLKLGVIELMDMSVKAMSPSVNDPTTALHAIDRIGEILLELAWRRRGDRIELNRDGRPLLLLRRPRLEDTVALAFNQIRHYASEDPAVARAMMRQLAELAALAPAASRAPFIDHLRAVIATAQARITDERDLQRVNATAATALARAAEGAATPAAKGAAARDVTQPRA
jgi:uncharacterized membrane protein